MEHGRANILIGEPFQHRVQWSPKQAFRPLVSGDSNYRPQRSMGQLNKSFVKTSQLSFNKVFLVRLDSEDENRKAERPSGGKRGSAIFPHLRQDHHFRRRAIVAHRPTEGHDVREWVRKRGVAEKSRTSDGRKKKGRGLVGHDTRSPELGWVRKREGKKGSPPNLTHQHPSTIH